MHVLWFARISAGCVCMSEHNVSVCKACLTITVLCVSSCLSDRSVQATDMLLQPCASSMQHEPLKSNAQNVALSNSGKQQCNRASEFHVIKVQM